MTTRRVPRMSDADGDGLRIFAVDQGFCALATAGKEASVLIDCGVNAASGFRPAGWLDEVQGVPPVRDLVLSVHADSYVADLPGVFRRLGSTRVHTNPSLLAAWKPVLASYTQAKLVEPAGSRAPDLTFHAESPSTERAPMTMSFFHNHRPQFKDSANLSLVTFLSANTFHVLLGAAMRADGWRALLHLPAFRERLRTVDVLVASRHGRHSGFCAELFEICEPQLIIVPDAASEAPVNTETYAPHASGLRFTDGSYRYVLFTRADGTISISELPDGMSVIKADASRVNALLSSDQAIEDRRPRLQRNPIKGERCRKTAVNDTLAANDNAKSQSGCRLAWRHQKPHRPIC